MKFKTSILTLLATALSAGSSWGQLPISPTSGIISTPMPASQQLIMAVPFAKAIPFEGTVLSTTPLTSPTRTQINLSGVSLPSLTNHSIYIATDVNPGNATGAYGRVMRILSNSATNVVVTGTVTPEPGDEFQIIEDWTLETLLGTGAQTSVQVTTGNSIALSDVVYLDVNGVLTGYWHDAGTAVTDGWKALAGSALTPNVPIPFGKSILVARKTGVRSLVVRGEAITGRFLPETVANATVLFNNLNLVSTPLINAPLTLTSGGSAALSDTVYIDNGGVLNGYWRRNTGNWYPITDTTGAGAAVSASLVLQPGKGLLVVDRLTQGISMAQLFNP